MTNLPTAPITAPTFTGIGQTTVTLNNVPALSTAQPVGFNVSGSGVSFENAYYTDSGLTFNGKTVYSANANHSYVQFDGSHWRLDSTYQATNTPFYQQSGPAATPETSVSSWIVGNGTAPAPVVTFNNSPTDAATSLNIQRALNSTFTTGLATFAGVTPSTNYVDGTVSSGTTYWYRYVEVNSTGRSPGPASSVTTTGASARPGYSYFTPATVGAEPNPLTLSVFSPDTSMYLADIAAGDTTTGYSASSYIVNGSSTGSIYGLADFGRAITPTSAQMTFQVVGGSVAGLGVSLLSSTDGVSWVTQPFPIAQNFPAGATTSRTITGSPTSTDPYRYWAWRIGTQWTGTPGTLTMTDIRFYASSGAEILTSATTGTNLSARGFADTLFSDTISRGPLINRPRGVTDTLFTDSFGPRGTGHAVGSFSDTLLSDIIGRGNMIYAPRGFTDALISDVVLRLGYVAPAGGHSVPDGFKDTLLSDIIGRGAVVLAARGFVDKLFTDLLGTGGRVNGPRGFTDALFSDSFRAGAVTPAYNPAITDNRDPFALNRQFLALSNSLRGKKVLVSKLMIFMDGIAASLQSQAMNYTSNRIAATLINVIGGDGISSTVYGTGSEKFIIMVAPAVDAAALKAQASTYNQGVYSSLFSVVTSYLSTVEGGSFPSITAWATAQNLAVLDSVLFHPNTAQQSLLYNNNNGALLLNPGNVFAPQTNFGAATVGAAGAITYTDASSIPTVNNPTTGSIQQGYTPSTGLTVKVTTVVNGTLVATVTFNGRTAGGAVVTGRTGTLTLSSLALGATATMVPTVAGDRIAHVVSIVATGTPTATAGAFTVDSVLERVVV
jgi:hypothetical protein